MKARPILLSTPMVQALLDGRKTQTRRIVRTAKGRTEQGVIVTDDKGRPMTYLVCNTEPLDNITSFCPYGQIGDLLWIRETLNNACDGSGDFSYKADGKPLEYPAEVWAEHNWGKPVIPSIFMPKWASRLTLEITNIKVEKLQDISADDARAEGIEYYPNEPQIRRYKHYVTGYRCADAVFSYHTLWHKINKRGSWESNPWVWVIEFKVHHCNIDEVISI